MVISITVPEDCCNVQPIVFATFMDVLDVFLYAISGPTGHLCARTCRVDRMNGGALLRHLHVFSPNILASSQRKGE
ncbi:hypothetical protein AC579_5663 [Pseudocercospora musae]|uniref:Uncharacterized protein n=1 Tax=Pseudocercospora musae TaxID=113226 RepID=A0A139IC00_9PEZI|nr:hypothetical protein AC579_5663 [Pseudocercospora musae]